MKSKYNPAVTSEYYVYHPAGVSASSVLIQNFRISELCDDFEGESDPEKMFLSFAKGSEVRVSRYSTSTIRLDVISESTRFRFNDAKEEAKTQTLAADLEGEKFENCVSFEILLSDTNPVFTLNVLGQTAIGQEITDSIDKYSHMFLSGEIIIEGKSTFSKSHFSYEPIAIPRGASIFAKLPPDHPYSPSDVLRASIESEGIDSSIMIYGGELFTQLYREKPRPVNISFINRLSSDNEAVIGFSALILLIQFLAAIIAFLMRLKFINVTTTNNQELASSEEEAASQITGKENSDKK